MDDATQAEGRIDACVILSARDILLRINELYQLYHEISVCGKLRPRLLEESGDANRWTPNVVPALREHHHLQSYAFVEVRQAERTKLGDDRL